MCELDSNHDEEMYCGNCHTCHECIEESNSYEGKLRYKLQERIKLLEDTLTKVYDNCGDTDFIINVVGDIIYPDTN